MHAVTTPTCASCGTKFPGRDSCKSCGRDPNAAPSVQSIVRKAVPESDATGRRRALKRSITSTPARRKRKHGR